MSDLPKTCSECPYFCATATVMNEWICMHPRWAEKSANKSLHSDVEFLVGFRSIGAPGVQWGIDALKGRPVWCPLEEAQDKGGDGQVDPA